MVPEQPIGAGEVVGYYDESPLYSDIGGQKRLKKTYSKDVMMVTVKQLSRCMLMIPNTVVARSCAERTSCIVSAPFCCLRYLYHARFLPGRHTTDIVRRSHPEQIKVSFILILSPACCSDLKLFGITAMNTLETLIEERGST